MNNNNAAAFFFFSIIKGTLRSIKRNDSFVIRIRTEFLNSLVHVDCSFRTTINRDLNWFVKRNMSVSQPRSMVPRPELVTAQCINHYTITAQSWLNIAQRTSRTKTISWGTNPSDSNYNEVKLSLIHI